MLLENNAEKPIYILLSEEIEDKILRGIYLEETQIPSTTEMSVSFKINPATANRAVNMLVEEGIIYKKRGIGMYVANDAVAKITAKRNSSFFDDFVGPMLIEAEKLKIKKDELMDMVKKGKI